MALGCRDKTIAGCNEPESPGWLAGMICAPRTGIDPAGSQEILVGVGEQYKKSPAAELSNWALMYWWRRRGSNPRPEILYGEFYILSLANWI